MLTSSINQLNGKAKFDNMQVQNNEHEIISFAPPPQTLKNLEYNTPFFNYLYPKKVLGVSFLRGPRPGDGQNRVSR